MLYDEINSIRQLKFLGLEWYRIDAVNGWKLSETDIAKFYSAEANYYQAKSPLTAPEIGCYISHLKAWESIASGNSAGGFIFEDDFFATTELASVLAEISDDGWIDLGYDQTIFSGQITPYYNPPTFGTTARNSNSVQCAFLHAWLRRDSCNSG